MDDCTSYQTGSNVFVSPRFQVYFLYIKLNTVTAVNKTSRVTSIKQFGEKLHNSEFYLLIGSCCFEIDSGKGLCAEN